MTEQQITDEAIKYCSCIDFTDDKNLNEKGREKVKEWSKQDFIAGAKWMQEQLRLSNVSQQSGLLFCDCKEPNFINTSADDEQLYCHKCELPKQNNCG